MALSRPSNPGPLSRLSACVGGGNRLVAIVVIALLVVVAPFYVRLESGLAESVHMEPPPMSDGSVDLRHIVAASLDITQQAGAEILDVGRRGNLRETSKGTLQNGVNDPRTEADLRSHRVIVGHLQAMFPGTHIVSEEKDGEVPRQRGDPDYQQLDEVIQAQRVPIDDVTIWVDPLDATKEFTEHIKGPTEEDLSKYVTVMVCVAVRGEPVAGVIYFPYSNKHYWGLAEQGTNFQPVHQRTLSKGGKFDVVISRSHAGEVSKKATEIGVGKVTPAGGAGYKAVEVLEGRQDAYLHSTKIKKWDVCAGDALLRIAGGRMVDWAGNDFDYSYQNTPVLSGGIAAVLDDPLMVVDKLKAAGLTVD